MEVKNNFSCIILRNKMEASSKLDQTDKILPGFEQGKIRDET
jgi:hypothetical protein